MEFEWDPLKERSNRKKHGVSFIEAMEVFGDKHASCVSDPDHSYGEARHLLFGLSLRGRALVVSFTEAFEVVRIISARPMTRQERRAYEQ